MATKNVAAKAAPKAESDGLAAGQKAAATKKANAKAVAESPAKPVKAAKPATAEATKPKATKAKAAEPEVKASAPKVSKAAVAKAATAEDAVPADALPAMGRKELAERVRTIMMDTEGVAVSSKVSTALVSAFELAVTTALQEGTEVALTGFGKFKVTLREGGTRRNPSTGESFEAASSWAASFKVGGALKAAVNERPTT